MAQQAPIWSPSKQRIAESNLTSFIKRVNQSRSSDPIGDYAALHQWSIENDIEFWRHTWHFCQLKGDLGAESKTLGDAKWQDSVANRDTIWFADTKLNYAENLLRYAQQNPEKVFILFANERGENQQLTGQQLIDEVSSIQQWLLECGVQQGDVVAGYLPYIAEAVIAMLATTSLGAIWTSTSPDFGVESIIERFGQVSPKVLFCCDSYQFNGKNYSMKSKNESISTSLSRNKKHDIKVCQIDYLEASSSVETNATQWSAILANYPAKSVAFQRVLFNHPLFILYSSGTTGQPKCIVHSVGGTLLNHVKEHVLHCDIKVDDKVFYYTTCGWMMWNWHVSALASGATLVIYDGSPVYPDSRTLWQLADKHGVTLFGTSAKYLEAIEHQGYTPQQDFQMPALRTLCSTGSALYPEQFNYVYQHIKSDLHLASISGGTDICGCFVIGNPISPVYKGECQQAGLAVDVQVLNPVGERVINQRGELTCTNALPNFPLGFWNDSGERYHNAYWEQFNNVWHHGDDVLQTQTAGFVFYGRSDATLNPGGVRIGTAEIYQQVNHIEGISDSIAIGKLQPQGEEIWLLVCLDQGIELDKTLENTIRSRLKTNCSPRHVPKQIFAISEIPKTRSGKLVELAVKQVVNGQSVGNIGAIANPEVLTEIEHVTADYR